MRRDFLILFIEDGSGAGDAKFDGTDDERVRDLVWRFGGEIVGRLKEAYERITDGVRECCDGIVKDGKDVNRVCVASWPFPELGARQLVDAMEGQVLRGRAEREV